MGKTKGRLRRNVRKTKGREKFLLEKSTPMVVKIVVNSTMTRAEKGQKKNAGRPRRKRRRRKPRRRKRKHPGPNLRERSPMNIRARCLIMTSVLERAARMICVDIATYRKE